MTFEEVEETAKQMLYQRTNDMTKIKIKCWSYHSKSRIKNGNEPYSFVEFSHNLGKQTYLDYIEYNLIDCSDIGGKESAIQVIEIWFR